MAFHEKSRILIAKKADVLKKEKNRTADTELARAITGLLYQLEQNKYVLSLLGFDFLNRRITGCEIVKICPWEQEKGTL